jgi:hypothetical protein
MRTLPAVFFAFLPLALQACSNTSPAADAGGDAALPTDSSASDGDAGGDAGGFPSCDPSKPFGAPVLIAELDTAAHDLFARLTPDELTVYFERYASSDAGVPSEKGGADLLVATRPSVTAPFGTPTLLASVNSSSNDFDPAVSGDDLTIYFASSRPGGAGAVDLWTATRPDTASQFGAITNVAALNSASNEHTPYVLADGLTLYFTGTAGSSLLRATRTSTTTAFAPDTSGVLDGINTSGAEVGPVVAPDELTLYFGSARNTAPLTLHVWKATRASKSAPFAAPTAVTEVNTAGNDVPAWISDDGCRLYLHSDVGGSYDIYVASKP